MNSKPELKDDFDAKECERIIAEFKEIDYHTLHKAFGAAAAKAKERNETGKKKVYRSFADACSMMLTNGNPMPAELGIEGPFSPLGVMCGKRSTIIDDFSEEQVILFSEVANDIENPWLRSRIADIAWLRLKHKDYARIAIDAYSSIQIVPDDFHKDVDSCWYRAISLAFTIRDEDRINNLKDSLLKAFCYTSDNYELFTQRVSELLLQFDVTKQEKESIAQKLEEVAKLFEEKGQLHESRIYFKEASKLYDSLKEKEKSSDMIDREVEIIIKQAESRTDSNMAANSFYSKAISKLRLIPNKYREKFNVEERMKKLRILLKETGEKIPNEMHTITYEIPVEETKAEIERAKEFVQYKNKYEALYALANVQAITDFPSLISIMQENSFSSMIPLFTINTKGQKVAKSDGLSHAENELKDEAIFCHRNHFYENQVSLIANISIAPALEQVISDHTSMVNGKNKIREIDFYLIARQSPVVPCAHEELFAKGLFAGYNGDYMTAIHILSTQIEALVRDLHVKYKEENIADRTHFDEDEIETERGLNRLIELFRSGEVFGENGKNIASEIKALFCVPAGPNLRNRVSHGELTQKDFNSPVIIYAWWFIFRLVMNSHVSWFKETQQQKDSALTY